MTSIRKRAPSASSRAVRRAMQAVASENTDLRRPPQNESRLAVWKASCSASLVCRSNVRILTVLMTHAVSATGRWASHIINKLEGVEMRYVCGKCGSVYELTEHKAIMRDRDSLTCDVCEEEMFSWNGAVYYTSQIIERGKSCRTNTKKLKNPLANRHPLPDKAQTVL